MKALIKHNFLNRKVSTYNRSINIPTRRIQYKPNKDKSQYLFLHKDPLVIYRHTG